MRRKRTRRSASGKRSVWDVVRRKTGTSILDEFWKPQSCPVPLLTTLSTRWPWGTCYDMSNVTHVRNVITLHGYASKAAIRQSWCGCEIPSSKHKTYPFSKDRNIFRRNIPRIYFRRFWDYFKIAVRSNRTCFRIKFRFRGRRWIFRRSFSALIFIVS